MTKLTAAERNKASRERLAKGVEATAGQQLWRHALAEAVIAVAARDGAVSASAILAELEQTVANDSPLDLGMGVTTKFAGPASAEAIECLRKALPAS